MPPRRQVQARRGEFQRADAPRRLPLRDRTYRLVPADLRFSAEDSLPEPRSKPDPAIYRLACDRLGVHAHETIAVEDSVPGVSSAVSVGIPTVGILQFVPSGERRCRAQNLLAAGACTVIHSWEELERLVPTSPGPDRSQPGALA